MTSLSQKHQLLDLLIRRGDWVHFADLNRICFRYGGRLHELRNSGIDIAHKQVSHVHFYKLITPAKMIDYNTLTLKDTGPQKDIFLEST